MKLQTTTAHWENVPTAPPKRLWRIFATNAYGIGQRILNQKFMQTPIIERALKQRDTSASLDYWFVVGFGLQDFLSCVASQDGCDKGYNQWNFQTT